MSPGRMPATVRWSAFVHILEQPAASVRSVVAAEGRVDGVAGRSALSTLVEKCDVTEAATTQHCVDARSRNPPATRERVISSVCSENSARQFGSWPLRRMHLRLEKPDALFDHFSHRRLVERHRRLSLRPISVDVHRPHAAARGLLRRMRARDSMVADADDLKGRDSWQRALLRTARSLRSCSASERSATSRPAARFS